MAAKLFLAVVGLIGLMWVFSRLGRLTPEQRRKMLVMTALYGGAGILVLLIVTGRLPWLFALLGALIPWLQRALIAKRTYDTFQAFKGSTGGKSSAVTTRFLRVTLDHDSGAMAGEVLEGRFEGQRLEAMALESLLKLHTQCREDLQSLSILEAYLDRLHGDIWREQVEGGGAGEGVSGAQSPISMSKKEAEEILGVESDAGRDTIIAAHRRLIQKLHPDRGGSDYLSARINQARDFLLDE